MTDLRCVNRTQTTFTTMYEPHSFVCEFCQSGEGNLLLGLEKKNGGVCFPATRKVCIFLWQLFCIQVDMKMIWAGLMGKYFMELFLQLYSYIETSLINLLDNKKSRMKLNSMYN